MNQQKTKYRIKKDMNVLRERVSMKEETTTPKKLLSHKGAIEKNRNRQQKTKQLKSTKNSKRVVGLWGLEII